jgi:hypothetical protein
MAHVCYHNTARRAGLLLVWQQQVYVSVWDVNAVAACCTVQAGHRAWFRMLAGKAAVQVYWLHAALALHLMQC